MVGPKGRYWISMPSTKAVDADGKPVLDRNGKPLWNNFVDFRDSAARNEFCNQVLDALRRQHPELFEGGAE